jgi:hypothetical protein
MKYMGNLTTRLPFLFPTLTRIYTDPDQKWSSEPVFEDMGSGSEFGSDFLVEILAAPACFLQDHRHPRDRGRTLEGVD